MAMCIYPQRLMLVFAYIGIPVALCQFNVPTIGCMAFVALWLIIANVIFATQHYKMHVDLKISIPVSMVVWFVLLIVNLFFEGYFVVKTPTPWDPPYVDSSLNGCVLMAPVTLFFFLVIIHDVFIPGILLGDQEREKRPVVTFMLSMVFQVYCIGVCWNTMNYLWLPIILAVWISVAVAKARFESVDRVNLVALVLLLLFQLGWAAPYLYAHRGDFAWLLH